MFNLTNIKEHKTRSGIIAGFITFFIIGLLLLAGPAGAFTVSLTGFDSSNNKPIKGEIISTTAFVEVNSNDRVDLETVGLYVNDSLVCSFEALAGNTSCGAYAVSVLNNSLVSDSSYGYGYSYGSPYGYGYSNGRYTGGRVNYNITINTTTLSEGIHSLQLKTNLGAVPYQSTTTAFNVTGSTVIVNSPIGSGQFEVSAFENPENATSVKVVSGFTITEGNNSVFLPTGTVITNFNGGTFNLSAIASRAVNLSTLSGFTGTLISSTEFGIPNLGLSFSTPITIRIYVGTALNGQVLNLYRSTTGNTGWEQTGLQSTTCTVLVGICEFNTTRASYFGATQASTTTTSTSSTIPTHSGSCRTDWYCSEWNTCTNGVQKRTCAKIDDNCYATGEKPLESKTCVSDLPVVETRAPINAFSRITGAFIGTLGTGGSIAVIIIFLVLVGLLIYVRALKNRKAKAKRDKEEDMEEDEEESEDDDAEEEEPKPRKSRKSKL